MIIFKLIFLLCSTVYAKEPIRVAVIDSGLDIQDLRLKDVLCKTGHKDFTNTTLNDNLGHGTHIVGLIKEYAGNANYCLVIYKYINKYSDFTTSKNSLNAFKYAIENKIKFINYSSGGLGYLKEEYLIIKNHPEVTFIVAAGNDGKELNDEYQYYLPSYNLPNIIPVGNLLTEYEKNSSSNYGCLVKAWEVGTNVISTLPNNRYGFMTGTSMSTAIHTGKLIKKYGSK